MSDLDQVKGLIVKGDKENAIVQLASIIIENNDDVEAWLLLGETIDDPSKKKDCYNWVLKLSPHNSLALTKLQELEIPVTGRQIASSNDAQPVTDGSVNKSKQNSNYFPNQIAYPTVNSSQNDSEIMIYFILGIVAVLVILYVIVTGNFSGYSNIFCGGLIFLSLSTVMIISFVINKNRG